MEVAEMVDEEIVALSAKRLRGVANRTATKTTAATREWNFSKREKQRYNMDASTLTGWTGGTPAKRRASRRRSRLARKTTRAIVSRCKGRAQ